MVSDEDEYLARRFATHPGKTNCEDSPIFACSLMPQDSKREHPASHFRPFLPYPLVILFLLPKD